MKIKISNIKINPGRREAAPEAVQELARSIAAVGLLNPITLDQNYTLIAGLHRLEAAKLLGWTEIECSVTSMDGLQAELAEIDENIVRAGLSRQEMGEQFLRRKEIYEMLHPETKAGAAQAVGMNLAIGNNVSAKLAPTTKAKPFVQDTAEKTGMSKRTISRLLQIANNLSGDARRIVEANDMTQDTALKISRLPYHHQAEAASLLAAGTFQSVDEYVVDRRKKILAARPPLPDSPPEDTRTEEEKEREKTESMDSLAKEFARITEQFVYHMRMYQGFAEAFAEMPPTQIGTVWDSAAAVEQSIIDFSKKVKAAQVQNENGGNDDEN